MVQIYSEDDMYVGCTNYVITATVSHKFGSQKVEPIIRKNKGCNGCITTAYKDVLVITLSDADPEFESKFAEIIKICTLEERNNISKIEQEIQKLREQKRDLENRCKGSYQ